MIFLGLGGYALLWVLVGYAVGWRLHRPAAGDRLLDLGRRPATPAPRFMVDAAAARVLAALGARVPRSRRAAVRGAARAHRVRFSPHAKFDPADPGKPGAFPYELRGGRITVGGGAGWERRLALALAHAAKHAADGDADPQMRDRDWFRAAELAVERGQSRLPAEEDPE